MQPKARERTLLGLQKQRVGWSICRRTLGKNCMIYLQKGRGVQVVGRLRQERWTDKDGGNRERIIVVAEHVEFRKVPNTAGKPEDTHALDELDQVVAF